MPRFHAVWEFGVLLPRAATTSFFFTYSERPHALAHLPPSPFVQAKRGCGGSVLPYRAFINWPHSELCPNSLLFFFVFFLTGFVVRFFRTAMSRRLLLIFSSPRPTLPEESFRFPPSHSHPPWNLEVDACTNSQTRVCFFFPPHPTNAEPLTRSLRPSV